MKIRSLAPLPNRLRLWHSTVPLAVAACTVIVVIPLARAQSDRVIIKSESGYALSWDGNNGGFSSPDPGAQAPDNDALASKGVWPFASSSIEFWGIHNHNYINDGAYGNSSSWEPDHRANPPDTSLFIGLAFGRTVQIKSIAWGRDNGDATDPFCNRPCCGTCMNSAVGIYTLQITRAANPGPDTPEGADPAAGWVNVGTVEYKAGRDDDSFRAHLRHRYDVSEGENAIAATGLRIKVSHAGINIDEIEVNPPPDPPPLLANFISITSASGYAISRDLNDGQFYSDASPARVPTNRALATEGTQAFGSSEFGAGVYFIANVIDGLYGDAHSWIPNSNARDNDPFIGLNFITPIEIKSIAWGRDNGDNTDCCGGELIDRALGVYIIQITRATNPGKDTIETDDASTGWVTVGQIDYRSAGGPFTPHRRHRYEIATAEGQAVVATGLRIKVPDDFTAIDEIEINPPAALEQDLRIDTITLDGADIRIAWTGLAKLEAADAVMGSWSEVSGATSPFQVSAASARQKFYRLRR